jgi:hypothetical protein
MKKAGVCPLFLFPNLAESASKRVWGAHGDKIRNVVK